MKATLNQADIELLTGTFVTKEDLQLMENRFNKKFASKEDLKKMENRIIKRVEYVDNGLDKDRIEVAKDVDRIKSHLGLQ